MVVGARLDLASCRKRIEGSRGKSPGQNLGEECGKSGYQVGCCSGRFCGWLQVGASVKVGYGTDRAWDVGRRLVLGGNLRSLVTK